MAFPAYRLPPDVETGMEGGPEFMTIIQEAISGREQRIQTWAECRARFDIAYPILDADGTSGTFREVIALFRAHLGRRYPFPFKDWTDYQATDAHFATGDGSETEFQLLKVYDPSQLILGSPGSLTYVREIYLPAAGFTIKVNGVTQTITTHYTVGATGLITFVSPPTNGHAVTWTGEFDIPVRFDTDQLPLVMNENSIAQISSIPIREVIGSDELA